VNDILTIDSPPMVAVGNRVRLSYHVELRYDVNGPADFLLNVHAAKTSRQRVMDEQFTLSQQRGWRLGTDPVTGNRIAAFTAEPGPLVADYSVTVDIGHRFVDPEEIVAESPSALPVSTLRYLYASRYCQTDMVQQQAWDLFGQMPRGYAQVRAVREWVHDNVRFQVGTSCINTSALDTLRQGTGVCRDFAHSMITYCRALNYPARIVTGVDYGADPGLGPPDFHAYVEVFLGGAWYLFEPTGISPITGLVRIATGRDAADVSFATIFGPVHTTMPQVEFSTVNDPARGLVEPAHCDLAVSTAD